MHDDERTCDARMYYLEFSYQQQFLLRRIIHFLIAIVDERQDFIQCNCLHGKCAYHLDEKSGQRLLGCVCLPGQKNKLQL